MNIIENKSRVYDATLVSAGAVQAKSILDIPQNILIKLIEDPIITVIGLMTIVLLSLRITRMLQKIKSEDEVDTVKK